MANPRDRGNAPEDRLEMWEDRNDRRCVNCSGSALLQDGTWRTLECHHINGNPYDNRKANKEPRCKRCHVGADTGAIRPEYYDMKSMLLGDGFTQAEIARQSGMTPTSVRYWLREYGLYELYKVLREITCCKNALDRKLSEETSGNYVRAAEQLAKVHYPAEV